MSKISKDFIEKQKANNKNNIVDFTGSIIIAPHPDDEIIGCYNVIKNEKPIIIYMGETNNDRRKEALALKEHTNISMQLFLNSIPSQYMKKEITFYFPDPIYETHPKHRMWGAMGEQYARAGFDVVFFSTNMNSPYIHEVENPKEKEELLNKVYPSQKDLWAYEKKYVLFEGYTKWIF